MTSSVSVLVVDDDRTTQMIHRTLCKRIGCEAQVAINGKEAVDMFRDGKKFDLLLMDMEMPVTDGPTATKALREMGVESIIVGVSSRDEEPQKSAFMAAGLNNFRTKPLKIDTLRALVQQVRLKGSI